MSMIQEALNKILSPVIYLVNEKMAPRSGVIGRFGKFFYFGKRSYGVHPINQYVKYLNHSFLMISSTLLHNYNISRFVGQKTHLVSRPFFILSLFAPLSVMSVFISGYATINKRTNINNSLEDLDAYSNDMMLPLNTMNNKISAHYIEINKLYSIEMLKLILKKEQEVRKERDSLSVKERKEKYANEGYTYELMKYEN